MAECDRERVRAQCKDALQQAIGVSSKDAARLEAACWARATRLATDTAGDDATLDAYWHTCRASVANVTLDPRLSNGNRRLAEAVRSGTVDISEIPSMTAEQLALGAHKGTQRRCAGTGDIANDAFECPRCTKRHCVHYELQTRSADEATTVFVTCVACNHRWVE